MRYTTGIAPLSVLALMLLAHSVPAVDGIVISGSKEKYMDVGGNSLIAYAIQNSAVAGKTTIATASIQSQPSINSSGTHVVFCRTVNSALWLSAVAVTGGSIVDVVQIASNSGYSDAWWLTDGNISVYYNCELHKVTFTPGATKTTIARTVYARFMCSPQGYYVGLSGAGDKVSWRIYKEACFGNTCGSTQLRGTIPAMSGATPPSIGEGVATFTAACGCGNAVSPSGEWTGCLQGSGHEGIGIHRWSGNNVNYYNVRFTTLAAWSGSTVGSGGDANRWAVNSDAWLATIAGIPDRMMSGGSDVLIFPIDTTKRFALNVTNHAATGATGWNFVPSFWVSTRADVNASLLHYLDNRDAWRAYWEKALRGQAAEPPAATGAGRVREPAGVRRGVSRPGTTSWDVYTIDGKRIESAGLRAQHAGAAERGVAVRRSRTGGFLTAVTIR